MDKMKIIDRKLLDELVEKAVNSERKRANHNIHEKLDDSVQRFLNAMEPGTYVQPHRHNGTDKWELFLILRGSLLAVIFNEDGSIVSRNRLIAGKDAGIEIPENTWHSLISLESGTIMFESKRGPYSPTNAKDFADWAPTESDPACEDFTEWFINGPIGSLPPSRR